MLSECKFSHVSNVFDSKRKKQTKIPQSWSFKSQKKNEEHGKKCSSNVVELEDSRAIGLPISVTVCQISSQSEFGFLRWRWFAAVGKSLQAKHCVTWWGVMREDYHLCPTFSDISEGRVQHWQHLLWCCFCYRTLEFTWHLMLHSFCPLLSKRKTEGFPECFRDFPVKQWGDLLSQDKSDHSQ